MAEILHQLRFVVYPIIYKVLYIPGGAGFLPSTVFFVIPLFLCWSAGDSLINIAAIHIACHVSICSFSSIYIIYLFSKKVG